MLPPLHPTEQLVRNKLKLNISISSSHEAPEIDLVPLPWVMGSTKLPFFTCLVGTSYSNAQGHAG